MNANDNSTTDQLHQLADAILECRQRAQALLDAPELNQGSSSATSAAHTIYARLREVEDLAVVLESDLQGASTDV